MTRNRIEWVGGIVSMPDYVTDEDGRYRPEMLIWMTADHLIAGADMGRPGEMVDRACESLQQAIEAPIVGRPHVPTRVRVASPELVKVLRSGHPGIDFVCAPTPDIDAFVAVMQKKLSEDERVEESYLTSDVGPEAMAALFHAAAALHRAEPWSVVPAAQCVVSVSIPELGVKNAALGSIGQNGPDRGLILFSCIDDLDEYLFGDGNEAAEDAPELPQHLSLSFGDRMGLSETMRQEIARHGWEVASPAAHPRFLAVDEDHVARALSATEARILEAIALALPKVLGERDALRVAWSGGGGVERSLSVPTHRGAVRVSLRIPYEQRADVFLASSALMEELLDLDRGGEELDPKKLGPLLDEIEKRFKASPEAASLDMIRWSRLLMDYAARELGATVATLDSTRLRRIVFGSFPRQVTTQASSAKSIIDELRAFYSFLGRECGLRIAAGSLRVFDDRAVRELEAALSDPKKFSTTKSIMMRGIAAGHDMSSKEGIDAWMRVAQLEAIGELREDSLAESSDRPSSSVPLRPMQRVDERAKKNQRKAARKARKKNR